MFSSIYERAKTAVLTIGPALPGVNCHGHIIEPPRGISGRSWFALPGTATLDAGHEEQGYMAVNNSDLEVDWLVAGAGAAGMTGAVVAHQLGGSVLVVEKESVYGGTTAKSGGVAWIPGNHRQA